MDELIEKTLSEKALEAFTSFRWYDALDIIALAVMFFALFFFLKRHRLAGFIKYLITFVLAIIIIFVFSEQLKGMYYIAFILGVSAAVLLAIVFQTDLRRGILKISSHHKGADHYSMGHGITDDDLKLCISEIIRATQTLAKNNTGALIIMVAKYIPDHIINSGTRMDSLVSAPLLECIFNTKAPLHDGAVLVRGNKIMAAGCFLPLSQDTNIPKDLGTRHRAALGVTETNDVMSIIVSEETGVISVVSDGKLTRYYDSAMLNQKLEQFYGLTAADTVPKKRRKKSDV